MHRSPLISLVLAPLVLQALARPHCNTLANGKAIYMLSNEQDNAVVALPIQKNGLLAAGRLTGTGGAGMNGMDADGKPAAPDPLFSQSSLTIAGNHLFAVNPGSNTVSMFAIDPRDPTRLTLVGQPVAVPGEFPVTVAASERNKLVCVGSSGAVAGVACSTFSADGIGEMDDLRVFDIGQTTPPVGPTNTVSHVFFSRDESTVFTTVKGDPATNKTGFLAAFPVDRSDCEAGASVAREGRRSSPAGTAVLFGSSTIPGSDDLFVTDASFGGAVLTNGGGRGGDAAAFTVRGKGVVDGQSATCWAAISPATNTAFVTDVGVNRLVEMSLGDASIRSVVDLGANGDPGLIDLRAAGRLVYALSPGNGTTPAAVTVVDAVTKKQVQHLQFNGGMRFGKNAQGMALLM
ncbi:putative 3-carboxymuconate cyclase [Rosellinia necatrix]|uniref:Putative 3-carboxymuconate cyclase n=1 Tax=Rosellinia necatrix TaxID=77044 RepID=A0A1S7UKH6_ROSNE|nr:putative 3-carboxymuconate cyclase [Rosellinia necatrix]